MLEKHNYSHFREARSPYQSGLKINRIEHDNGHPSQKEKLVREYQSIVGGINYPLVNHQHLTRHQYRV